VGGDAVLWVAVCVVGLCFGSFLNVCILRLPNEAPGDRSLLHPPSTCPHCKRRIEWHDNIPVISWVLLGGKCRWCRAPISRQYPLIEAIVALIWIGAFRSYGFTLRALAASLFETNLLGIAIIDWRHKVIPDEMNYAGLAIGIAIALAGGVPALTDALVGAAVGAGLLWLVRIIGGWAFKQEAMGLGDVKMMAMVGAFVGWKGVLLTIFLGALIGTLVYVPLLLSDMKRMRRHELPFGVFLALGAAIAFVSGDSIISWYLQFLHGA